MLPDWLRRSAENFPDRLALQCGRTHWTFAELDRRASHLARQLINLGIGEQSRVALLAANSPDYVVFVHALIRLGAILVPLNTRLSLAELCWQLRDARVTVLVNDAHHAATAAEIGQAMPELERATFAHKACCGEQVLHRLPAIEIPLRSEIDLTATHVIMYTSGTTGSPKGVIITYGMQWWNAVGSALNMGLRDDDRWLACMPLFHIGGLSILMRSVIYGMGVIMLEKFDAVAVNQLICEEGATIVSVVSVMLQRMLATLDAWQRRYPSSLRCVLLGGGPAPRPLLEDCLRRQIPVLQTYGLTESCSQAATLAPEDALRKVGSAGKPLMPVQLCIMQDDRVAPVGEPGVIMLKGPTITPGYVDRPEETARAFKDGWFSTGDIGYLDAEGYLYVLDRRADLIISGGENVYPAEIEAVLLAHHAVEEAGVCGLDDERWGQVPVAFVRLRPGSLVTTAELLAYAGQRLARYKLPKAIYIVEQLPRNSAGKLVRRELLRLLPAHKPAHEDLSAANSEYEDQALSL
ncbi:MAG: o-succinylbenzoate--CoA ligase [Ktedonobacteraceae bacterium]|nr:o-succinylbenzoate--CoA ligase [Ktedonobacteraceae bacterium]